MTHVRSLLVVMVFLTALLLTPIPAAPQASPAPAAAPQTLYRRLGGTTRSRP